MQDIGATLGEMPIVAILRGVRPHEVEAIASAILDSGIGIIEVPLNSPDAFDSIAILARRFGEDCVVGAGTVLAVTDVDRLAQAGGRIAVMPNTDPEVIAACREHGIEPMPGFLTPTEAFAAYTAGARWLKLFPASALGEGYCKALSAVLPRDAKIIAVGGVGADNLSRWRTLGFAGFGIGGELYRPGATPEDVAALAHKLVAAARKYLQSA